MKTFSTRRLLSLLLLCTAALLAALPARAQTMVRLHTTQGPIDMTLFNAEAPVTVNNFLAYLRAGDYTDVFFHRSVPGFVIQGGGFRWPAGTPCCTQVASRGPIPNEFSPTRSNRRGTVAMAKLGGDPNSATSQWFINMNNNAANLDTQNGGFTVFAIVTPPGMVVADRIAALPRVNAGGAFSDLPVAGYQGGNPQRQNLVLVTAATEFPAVRSTSDRIFNYLEAAYPEYLGTARASEAGEAMGYQYRYYAATNAYIGTKDGKVHYLVPAINGNINELGTMAEFLATAQANGY